MTDTARTITPGDTCPIDAPDTHGITEFRINGIDINPETIGSGATIVYDQAGIRVDLSIRGPLGSGVGPSVRWVVDDGSVHELKPDGTIVVTS